MGGRRRCCCECPHFIDDFSRPEGWDPDVVGPDWLEVSGDWDIDMANAWLTELGSEDAILQCLVTMLTERMTCSFITKDEQAGDVYRAIVNYKDSTHFMYAQLAINAWTDGVISFWSVNGPHIQLGDSFPVVLTGKTRVFTACVSTQVFSATVSTVGANFCVWVDDGWKHEGGHYAGVGNGASQEINVDDFGCLAHYDFNRKCDQCCPCYCLGAHGTYYPPMELTATYDGTDDCVTLDGFAITLSAQDTNLTWQGTLTGGAPGSCQAQLNGLKLTLTCNEDPDDITTWKLVQDPTGIADLTEGWCGVTDDKYSEATISTCDPFVLVFTYHIPHSAIRQCPSECGNCGRIGPADPLLPGYWMDYSIVITP